MTGPEFNEMYKRFQKDYPTEGKDLNTIIREFRSWQMERRPHVTYKQRDAIKEMEAWKANLVLVTFMRGGKKQTRWRNKKTGLFSSEVPKGWKGESKRRKKKRG